jgi:hypothetical protein
MNILHAFPIAFEFRGTAPRALRAPSPAQYPAPVRSKSAAPPQLTRGRVWCCWSVEQSSGRPVCRWAVSQETPLADETRPVPPLRRGAGARVRATARRAGGAR